MLIPAEDIIEICKEYNISLNGVLHIGAHECEEMEIYEKMGITKNNMIWIDGNKDKVKEAQNRGIPNVYYAVIADDDDKEVEFKITNNGQSSSILDFGSHSHHHPHIHFVEKQIHTTTTIDTFYKLHNFDNSQYDFWNFDIQGAELMALKGAKDIVDHAKLLYLEVNTEEVYKGCALITDLDEYLSKYNFKRIITKMTHCGWGDALYIKVPK